MTAKRFTVDDGLEDVLCWEINDKENENMTCGECAKLLNELHEENQKLKDGVEELNQICEYYEGRIKELKERNNRQAKRLGELYELIAKKDWESLIEIIDDFCSCEEQLQREWKCYDDF